jgi:hypothetical protein
MRKGPGSVYDKWNMSVVIYNGQPSLGGEHKTFNITKRNLWFSSFLVSSNPLSRKS